jgi:predicted metal-binding protein
MTDLGSGPTPHRKRELTPSGRRQLEAQIMAAGDDDVDEAEIRVVAVEALEDCERKMAIAESERLSSGPTGQTDRCR